MVPEKEFGEARRIAYLGALFLGRRGGALTHFPGRGFRIEVARAGGFAAVGEIADKALFDDEGGDAIGCVDDAFLLALAADAAAGRLFPAAP